MKKLLLILFCIAINEFCFSQAGMWTWMKGDSTGDGSGYFGIQGNPDPLNNPPAVYEAGNWTDHQGNFWLFGGVQDLNMYSALWKYEVINNEWTWVNGSSSPNQSGVYGIKGVPSPNNHPGCRAYGFLTWVDANNNLCLYGGYGFDANGANGTLSDLWVYNISLNEWTWMSGSNTVNEMPTYSSFQIFDPSNLPGARNETTTSLQDNLGRMWFYGGNFDGGFVLSYGDLWAYDPSINQWAWMSGDNYFNPSPSWGTLGVFNSNNTPGRLDVYASWIDQDNKFWMFGGDSNIGSTNFVWVFDPSLNQWCWKSGSGSFGNAGTKCDTSNTFIPNGRFENKTNWADDCGNYWTFGGYDDNNIHNDLWFYSSIENIWAWVSGDININSEGFYGTKGIPSANNIPPARFGAPSWKDASGNFWLFGGFSGAPWYTNIITKNDLWKFVPDMDCPQVPVCNSQFPFYSVETILCEKFCTNFFDQSTNNPTSWQWNFEGGTPATSTDQNPTNICYNDPGSYDVTLITTNANGNDTLTLANYITVYNTPPFPTITQNGYTLTSSSANSYQWQLNSANISGATNQSYQVLQSGLYTVIAGDSNGCVNSISQYVLIDAVNEVNNDFNISIYPNPAAGKFVVELLNAQIADEILIRITNPFGQKVFSSIEKIKSASFKKEINLENISNGVYFIEIQSADKFYIEKIVIAK